MRRTLFPLAFVSAVILILAPCCLAKDLGAAGHTADGAKVYQANCSMCHGEDGSGTAVGKSLHIPDLRSGTVQVKSNAALAHFISEGSGPMPPFKNTLDHQQILDTVRHIRTLSKHNGVH